MKKTAYWTILSSRTDELLAIIESALPDTEVFFNNEIAAINKTLDHAYWIWGREITDSEFGTYQAFGIKEIKIET